MKKCPDCAASPGALHERGCDVERCPLCGGQLISCGCCYRYFYPTYDRRMDWRFEPVVPFFGLPEDVYDGGLSPFHEKKWEAHLAKVGRLPWTGEWPGVAECREFGWYSYLVPGEGWVSCSADHPDATEDLNRLVREAMWDKAARRFVRRT